MITKKILLLTALPLLLLGASSTIEAGDRHRWNFSIGFNTGARYHRPYCPPVVVAPPIHRHVRHHHVRVPVYRQVWVAARYQTVLAGYDRYGRPIYRSVCVSPGHYESVVASYRCSTCSHRF